MKLCFWKFVEGAIRKVRRKLVKVFFRCKYVYMGVMIFFDGYCDAVGRQSDCGLLCNLKEKSFTH